MKLVSFTPVNNSVVTNLSTPIVFDLAELDTNDPDFYVEIIVDGDIAFTYENNTSFTSEDFNSTPIVTLTTFKVTLVPVAPFTNPSQVSVQASAIQDTTLDVDSTFTITSLSIIVASPTPGQQNVVVGSGIALGFQAGAEIKNLIIKVQGVQAVETRDNGETALWNSPDFTGQVTKTANIQTVLITKRRAFSLGEKVTIDYDLVVTATGEGGSHYLNSYQFYVTPVTPSYRVITTNTGAIDRAMAGFPAAEALRNVIVSGLRLAGSSAPTELLAYAKVKPSNLGSVASYVLGRSADVDVEKLPGSELASTRDIAQQLQRVEILWGPAIREAKSIGIDQDLLVLIDRVHSSSNMVDLVASFCALLLWMTRHAL